MPFSSPSEIYTDVDSHDNINPDTTRPDHSGLDDSQRPTVDSKFFVTILVKIQYKLLFSPSRLL